MVLAVVWIHLSLRLGAVNELMIVSEPLNPLRPLSDTYVGQSPDAAWARMGTNRTQRRTRIPAIPPKEFLCCINLPIMRIFFALLIVVLSPFTFYSPTVMGAFV